MNNYLNNVSDESIISTSEDRQKVINYLILCAEEYMWVKKGRIPTDIWANWKVGIKHHL